MGKIKSRRKRKRIANRGSHIRGTLYGLGVRSVIVKDKLYSIDIGRLTPAQIQLIRKIYKTPTYGFKFKNI